MISSVPVQRLGGNARAAYLQHLHALDAEDRRLRFGIPQSAAAIAAYVERINFDRDVLFGVHGDELVLDGVAHLAFGSQSAELGLSVLPRARRRGIGSALTTRAAVYARNRSFTRLHVYCLADNGAMIRLARRLDMRVVVQSADAEAHIPLPSATPLSVVNELVEDQVALLDYALRSSIEAWRLVSVALCANCEAAERSGLQVRRSPGQDALPQTVMRVVDRHSLA